MTPGTSYSPPPAFGRFKLLHQIGAGVLGPVFRTHDPDQDRLVAVKAFTLDLTPEQASALAAEFERLAALGIDAPCLAAPNPNYLPQNNPTCSYKIMTSFSVKCWHKFLIACGLFTNACFQIINFLYCLRINLILYLLSFIPLKMGTEGSIFKIISLSNLVIILLNQFDIKKLINSKWSLIALLIKQ